MSRPDNAAALIEYLAERGHLRSACGPQARLTTLTGGVSAETVLIEAGQERLVLKRALGRLLVAGEWHAKPERAMTEAAAISALHAITPAHVPRLLDADSEQNTLVMEAAPADWVNWKTVLMGQAPDPSAGITATAGALGRVLGTWHSRTWGDPAVAGRFADAEAFEQLRISPFYRVVAARHPAVAARVAGCVAHLETTRDCLVHGDYSPKNVLVGPDGLMVLDFEVAHTGAAVFDVAFMQSHLVLKALHRPASAAAIADGGGGLPRRLRGGRGRPDGHRRGKRHRGRRPSRRARRLPAARPGRWPVPRALPDDGDSRRRARARPGTARRARPGHHRHLAASQGGCRVSATTITAVGAWEALDSRGRPTVAARVLLAGGAEGVALVPSGASAGSHEAVELRDGGPRYAGRGVLTAVANVNTTLAALVIGREAGSADAALAGADEPPRFAAVGANAVLAVSLAAARADAAAAGMSLARRLAGNDAPLLLPMPMVNVISGGAHAGGVLDVQDFLVVPVGATCFAQAIEWAAAVREAAARLALSRGHRRGGTCRRRRRARSRARRQPRGARPAHRGHRARRLRPGHRRRDRRRRRGHPVLHQRPLPAGQRAA